MKQSIGFTIFFTTALFLFSCSNNNQIEFSSGQRLAGALVEEISVFSRGNVYLTVADTFLVVATSDHEPFLRIYSTNTHKLLKEYGKEGRGPREFLSVTPLHQTGYDTENDSPILHVHDFKRNKIASINLKKLIEGEENFSLETPPQSSNYLTFVHYWDEDYLIATPSAGGNLFIKDFETSQSVLIPYLPKVEFAIPDNSLSTVYRPAVAVNKAKEIIAATPLYLGEINFFDFEGNLITTSIFESREAHKEELEIGISHFNDIKQQIVELDTNGDYIYGLNYNTSVKDNNADTWNAKVQVFDWEGNPVIEYPLDGRPILSFAVDKIHNRIYAYDPTEEEHNIVAFELN